MFGKFKGAWEAWTKNVGSSLHRLTSAMSSYRLPLANKTCWKRACNDSLKRTMRITGFSLR